MGLPFSKIIQNGQEYDVVVPAPSSVAITNNTRVSDIQTLIANSVAKGFIPYVLFKSTGNNIATTLHLDSFYEGEFITFASCSNGNYNGDSGSVTEAVIVNKLQITSSSITFQGIGVNKSASVTRTLSMSNLVMYYK